jgi:integrase
MVLGVRGSIQKRGTAWRIVIDNGVVDGKRSQIVRTCRGSRDEAEKMLTRLLSEHDGGVRHNGDATVAQLLDEWMRMHARNLSPTTARDYRYAIDKHLPAKLAATQAWRIRTHDVDRLYGQLADGGLGADRIQRINSILNGAFGLAVKWQWIARNPVADATVPTVSQRKPAVPTTDEVRRLLAAADTELLAWIQLSAHFGTRRGELAALQWRDLDLEASPATVTIRRALVDAGKAAGGIVAKSTKTDRERTIAIAAPIVAVIRSHRAVALERALAVGGRIEPAGYVFARDALGISPWRPDYATWLFGRLRDSVGLPHAQLKNLRHFMITSMLSAGIDVKTVSGRAGHAKTSMTLDVYAGWRPPLDAEAADVMGRLLG